MDEAKVDRSSPPHFRWALGLLGVLLTASSIISLIQHSFGIHLTFGFAHFVEFYRSLITPLLDVLLWPIQFILRAIGNTLHIALVIPQWMKDIWTLSFIGAGFFGRWAGPSTDWFAACLMTSLIFVIGVTGLGLRLIGFLVLPLKEVHLLPLRSELRKIALATAVAVLVFYIGNAAIQLTPR